MKWSKTLADFPGIPGQYWFRRNDGQPLVAEIDMITPTRVMIQHGDKQLFFNEGEFEWAGPIPQPEG